MIRVSTDGHGFTDSDTGRRFVPFGANYFDPKTGWAPKIWSRYDHERVERQLGQIAGAGFNCIRVFLDFKTLAPAERQYSEEGFDKVDDMVGIADKLGIRIIFSGPSSWEGPPAYLSGDEYADPRRMDLTCDMLAQLAARYGKDPTVMTWDLRNEPMVRFLTRDDPDAGPRLALWQAHAKERLGIEADDFPTWKHSELGVLREYVRFLEGLADNWVRRQVEALRQSGAKNLISVGNIQWVVPIHIGHWASYPAFNVRSMSRYLDYMSIHFYPMLLRHREGIQQELALQKIYLEIVCRGGRVEGKPLVLEEFGWKGGKQVPKDHKAWPQEEQVIWGEALMEVSSRVASGWLNWGYADAADPAADISAASGLWTEDEELKLWGRRFAEYARRYQQDPPPYAPAGKQWTLDKVAFLKEHNGLPTMQPLADMLAADPVDSVELVFRE
jgi:hypothetical protein